MTNYFDGKFHEVQVRLLGTPGIEIEGRSYRRQKAWFKFEALFVGDPRKRGAPEVVEMHVINKQAVEFPKVGKDWKPKYIYAAEIMTKEGKGIYQIRHDQPTDTGNKMMLQGSDHKKENPVK